MINYPQKKITLVLFVIFGYLFFSYPIFGYSSDFLKKTDDDIYLIQSDKEKVVVEYRMGKGQPLFMGIKSVKLIVPPTGDIQPQLTGYIFESKNPDGTIRRIYHTDSTAPDITQPEISGSVTHNLIGFIRDYRIIKLNINFRQTIKISNNEILSGYFSYFRIEIPQMKSEEVTISAGLRNPEIGLENALRPILLNYDESEDLRGKPSLPSGNNPFNYPGLSYPELIIPGNQRLKLSINQQGIYKIDYQDFLEKGISPEKINPESFKIFGYGKEIPITIDLRESRWLSSGDKIYFYAEPVKNIYTETGIYWLTWGGETGMRIPIINEKPDSASPALSSYNESIHLEENHMYEDYVNSPQKDRWFWNYLSQGQSTSIQIMVYNLDTTAQDTTTPSIQIHLYGKTDTPAQESHRIIITLNGSTIGSGDWNGRTYYRFSQSFPMQYLKNGHNTLSLSLSASTSGTNNEVYLDYLEFNYPRQIILNTGTMELTASRLISSNSVNRVLIPPEKTLFQKSIPIVYEIKPSLEITRIIPTEGKLIGAHTFELTSSNKYYIVDTADLLVPSIEIIDKSNNLRSTENQADILFITHPDFLPAVQQLSNYRKEQGFHTQIVNIFDIYNQFSYGNFDPRAIHDFLQYSFYFWKKPAPNFVVLVGDANWDYMDYQGTGTKNYIPSYRSPAQQIINTDSGSVEDFYVEISGNDNFPDMILGRISVHNLEDAHNVVEKTIAQETASELGIWRTRTIIATDDGFENDGRNAGRNYLPLWMKPDFLFQQDYGYLDHQKFGKASRRKQSPDATRALLEKMNQGSPFVAYIGHGGGGVWSHERLFMGGGGVRTSDTMHVQNKNRFLFIYTMSCLNGYFDYPNPPWQSILAEEMLRYPNRGSIAMFVPTGKGGTGQHMSLYQMMTDAFFKYHLHRLGEALYQAKINYLMQTFDIGISHQYLIMGDPLALNAFPQKNIKLEATPSIFRKGEIPKFQLKGMMETGLNDGWVTIEIDNNNYETVFIKENLKFKNGEFQIPITLPNEFSEYKIRAYAWNEKTRLDAAGGMLLPIYAKDIEFGLDTSNNSSDPTLFKNNPCKVKIRNLLPFDLSSYSLQAFLKLDKKVKQKFSYSGKVIQKESLVEIPLNLSPGIYELELKLSSTLKGVTINRSTSFRYIINDYGKTKSSQLNIGIYPMDISVQPDPSLPGNKVNFVMPVYNYSNTSVENLNCQFIIPSESIHTTLLIPKLDPYSTNKFQYQWSVPTNIFINASQSEKNIPYEWVFNHKKIKLNLLVKQLPDLVIGDADIKMIPEKAQDGQTIYFDVTIHNEGGSKARGIVVNIYDGNPENGATEISNMAMVGKPSIPELQPGESKTLQLRWDPIQGIIGKREMYFIVDYQKLIPDMDRANQLVIKPLTIYTSADLSITPNDLKMESLSGDKLQVTAVIHNLGQADAITVYPWGEESSRAFDVKLYTKDTAGKTNLIETTYIPILYAEDSQKVTFTLPITSDLASIIVKVDHENEVLEMDEMGNNQAEKQIDIKKP